MNAQARPQQSPPSAPAMARLEAELTALWGHINAAEYRFLALLAEFDRLEGYARHGLARPANEAVLLNVALNGTVHHVETLVRRYRRARRARD